MTDTLLKNVSALAKQMQGLAEYAGEVDVVNARPVTALGKMGRDGKKYTEGDE